MIFKQKPTRRPVYTPERNIPSPRIAPVDHLMRGPMNQPFKKAQSLGKRIAGRIAGLGKGLNI